MSIDATGWLDWTDRHPGVPDKVFAQPNSGARGIVGHSMEGSLAGSESRFMSLNKDPKTGFYTGYAQASVMFENPKVGNLIQMYPVTGSTWTSGNFTANTTLWAVESEGVAGEELTDSQVANLMRLVGEWETRTSRRMVRDGTPDQTFWEHREVWNWDAENAGPTSCPSGRYARFYLALALRNKALEDDMAALDDMNRELVRRFAIIQLASDPDSSKVDAAIIALKAANLVAATL